MQILVIGDSFAANWSVKYNDYAGWPELLAHDYNVTNLAQAGVSEYKILLQVESITNIMDYDIVVVSHTSPYRLHTRRHPVHHSDPLHTNSDLVLKDCEYHAGKPWNWFNKSLQAAVGFFKYHFDEKYYETIYTLLRNQINQKLLGIPVIVINNLPGNVAFATETTVLDFSELWNTERGLVNHFSEAGNVEIYNTIKQTIEQVRRKKHG